MIKYASRTGTRKNLDQLRRYGWRLVISATGVWRSEGFAYGLDNGAWTEYQSGQPWDAELFERAVHTVGSDADWIVCPDVVGDSVASLARTREWYPMLTRRHPLVLLAVQDGMAPEDIDDMIGGGRWVGIFVGGSTTWKESSLQAWGIYRRKKDCYLHVGRVNTNKRIAMCVAAGAHSFDGTSPSLYSSTTARISRAVEREERALGFDFGLDGVGDDEA